MVKAPGCGPGDCGFESHHSPLSRIAKSGFIIAPVAQLDRAPDFESVGCAFESRRGRLPID